MKKFIIIIFLIISSIVVWGQKIVETEYNVRNYNKIETGNIVEVKIVAGNKEGVVLKCDDRLIPAVEIQKSGSRLNIGLDKKELKKIVGGRIWGGMSISRNNGSIKINGVRFNGRIEVIVYVKEINEISVAASGDVTWEGSLPTNELRLISSSSGDITWKGLLEVNKLYINCSSSGDIEGDYKGKEAHMALNSSGDYEGDMEADDLIIQVSSSADFEGDVTATNLDVRLSSSADFKGNVKAENASFVLSSSADASVSGNITSLYVSANSSADFYGKKIVYEKAEVKTSSSANIYLSKSGELIDNTPRRTGVFVE